MLISQWTVWIYRNVQFAGFLVVYDPLGNSGGEFRIYFYQFPFRNQPKKGEFVEY